MEPAHKQLDCSFKTILSVSLPLILSALSSNLLYIIDRMILAKYSLNAMNAAVMSGSLVAIYAFFWSSISGIAEVYVGQSNGRKDYGELAKPVWQMIYFSLLGFVFYFQNVGWVKTLAFRRILQYNVRYDIQKKFTQCIRHRIPRSILYKV